MTKEDKIKIFNLIKTASDNFYGYETPNFSIEKINFQEKKIVPKTKNESYSSLEKAKTENQNIPKNENENSTPKEHFNFESLNEKIIMCNNCAQNIRGKGKFLTSAEDFTNLKVLIVNLIPLKKEENAFLDKMLLAIGLKNKENCFVTSILKCIPLQKPTFTEFQGCKRFIETEIHIFNPKFILFMGKETASLILGENAEQNTSEKIVNYQNIPTITTFSVEEILKNQALKRPAWEDLKILKSRIS